MEPAEAALLAGEEACCHWIEGIAGGFVPPLIRGIALDGTHKVSSDEAIQMTRRLNREFGLLVGSSSGQTWQQRSTWHSKMGQLRPW